MFVTDHQAEDANLFNPIVWHELMATVDEQLWWVQSQFVALKHQLFKDTKTKIKSKCFWKVLCVSF